MKGTIKQKIIAGVLITILLLITALYFYNRYNIIRYVEPYIFFGGSFAVSIVIVIALFSNQSTAEKEVTRKNTGQYGNAEYLSEEEILKQFEEVKINQEYYDKPGFVMMSNLKKNKMWVDTSDRDVLLKALPGSGKTLCVISPTLLYNAMVKDENKASLLITDSKDENYNLTANILKKEGYNVKVFNFRETFKSDNYNMLFGVSKKLHEYKTATTREEQIENLAEAESQAKLIAASIVQTEGVQETGSSKYFNDSARGLITAFILLVCYYGDESQANVTNVITLLVDLNKTAGNPDNPYEVVEKKFSQLINALKEKQTNLDLIQRIEISAGTTLSAENKVAGNIFSSSLAAFQEVLDIAMEQVLCATDTDFKVESFINEPTAIYIIIPDEKPTRHFVAGLIYYNVTAELINYAETKCNGKLSRTVLIIQDEFGNAPKIADFDKRKTAIRSRGCRSLLILQSESQLEKVYGEKIADIINNTSQIKITSSLAPSNIKEAKAISEGIGTYTASSYTTNKVFN